MKKKLIFGCEARGDAQSPYLTRYTLLATRMGQLCLHVFHRSDSPELHDHPWPFWTFILWRGYWEETPKAFRRLRPFTLHFRPSTWTHRVELTAPHEKTLPAVTLVWMGNRERNWGFFTAHGWQAWREYFQERGC